MASQSIDTSQVRCGAFVRCVATCSVLRSQGTVDVLAPAWGVRKLCSPLPTVVDLSLVRSLSTLQLPSGGFDCSADLMTALGLRNPSIVVEALLEDATSNQLSGALLVLKTAKTYFSESWDAPLQRICHNAAAFCCQCLGISEKRLWVCLQHVETPTVDLKPLPASAIAMLRANFGTRVLWSQCDLWIPLLSAPAQHVLQNRGGVLCPRNFLVDLATVSRCPHDYHAKYFLYRQKGQLFVGTVAEEDFCFDAMRQGRHLEASIVCFGCLEEDRVIMETTLSNGLLLCYGAAPDALSDELDTPQSPLEAGDEVGYSAAGYELCQVLDGVEGGDSLRIWKAARAPTVSTDYIEVKKTTHLHGQGGEYKRSKFWMQAALAACGGVLVATTADSHDKETASTFTRSTLDELEATISHPTEMWSELEHHLQDAMEETAAREGQWTLFVGKRRHGAVSLQVKPGWDSDEHLHDVNHIGRATDILNVSCIDAEHFERGDWEMQSGRGWSTWKPHGLDFLGLPGEVHYFNIGGQDYRVVFGPEEGVGVQENLVTGRKRNLRMKDTTRASFSMTGQEDFVQQLCDMGFSHMDVTRCLQLSEGDSTKAVEKLLSNM